MCDTVGVMCPNSNKMQELITITWGFQVLGIRNQQSISQVPDGSGRETTAT